MGPQVLLVEDGVEAAGVSFREIVSCVLVGCRNLLRYDLSDFIKMRVHRFVRFLRAFRSLADRMAPVLMVPVLAWRRYRLLYFANLFCERDFRIVAKLALWSAGSSIDFSLRPVGVLCRFVFSRAWHNLFLFGMLVEE